MIKKDNEQKKINSLFKWIFATVLVMTIGIGGSFFGGTFYPNVWTVDKLHKQFQKQELDEAHLLGLQEPEFEYIDKEMCAILKLYN